MASSMGERLVITMIKFPVFIGDKNGKGNNVCASDISVYASIEDAQLQLEPVDVLNDEYIGYDAEGKLLRIEVENNRVVISLAEENPSHAQELEDAIRTHLKEIDEPIMIDQTCDLSCLVKICLKYI